MSIFTGIRSQTISEMLLDSSFAIALPATSDQFHRKAVEISGRIQGRRVFASSRLTLCFSKSVMPSLDSVIAGPRFNYYPGTEEAHTNPTRQF